ncbi:MAG TPA: aldehyde dehydrogenase family protein [Fimbriimonas sp.]|nr:aldehyde dehydrogenase family protein [Fimbriimonas sp.]
MATANLKATDPLNWQSDGRPVPEVVKGNTYLIGGEIREWSGQTNEVQSCLFFNWNDGILRPKLGSAPVLDANEALDALKAAQSAWDNGQGKWPTMTVAARIEAVQHFVSRMKSVRNTVVELIMWEIGKNQPDAEKEFDRTVQYIEDTIDALKDLDRKGSGFSVEKGFLAQIRRSPFGPTLCMGPYNYPLNETFTTLIPAIMMGNPVISKLPRFGQLLNTPLLEAFKEAFPPGVVNIINGKGSEIIPPILQHGGVELLAFIGGSKTADQLKTYHPKPHRLKSILSLDAKNLAVVLPDADMAVTIPQLVAGTLGFNGQRCTALKILFVHKSRVDEVLEKLSDAVDNLQAGLPWKKGVALTPLADINATKWLTSLLEEATSMGAKIVNPGGGEVIENFMKPAIVYPVTPEMKLHEVEQFGPIIPIRAYEDISEVMDYAVETQFGQQVSLFGYDPKVLGPLIDAMVNQVSRVNLNVQCQRGPDTFPFTGRKASAEGTLSVADALKRFSIRTLVATDYTEANRELINSILAARSSNFLTTDFLF